MNRNTFRKPTALVVLAGGKSRRMGGDKALLTWKDRPFVVLPFERSRNLFDQRILVANQFSKYRETLRTFGWDPRTETESSGEDRIKDRIDLVSDQYPERGPVAGIHAGLSHTRYARALVIACDMPLVTREVMAMLIRAYDRSGSSDSHRPPALVPVVRGRRQPLCGIYPREGSEKARECLEAGQRSVDEFLDRLHVMEWRVGERFSVEPETIFF